MSTPTIQSLLEQYESYLNKARHARFPNPFLNRADEIEDKLLKRAERSTEAADQIIPVIEARYEALGLLK